MEKEGQGCPHLGEKEDKVENLRSTISSTTKKYVCQQCIEVALTDKSKGELVEAHIERLKSENIWICSECEMVHCGADFMQTVTPYGHAQFHFDLHAHPLVVSLLDLQVHCFECKKTVLVGKTQDLLLGDKKKQVKELPPQTSNTKLRGRPLARLTDDIFLKKRKSTPEEECIFEIVMAEEGLGCSHLGAEVQEILKVRSTISSAAKHYFCQECLIYKSKGLLVEVAAHFKRHESQNIWICSKCKMVLCGVDLMQTAMYCSYGHALLHFYLHSHPLAVSVLDLQVYCFECKKTVLVGKSQDLLLGGKKKQVQELPPQTSNTNLRGRYQVIGLANLGNTCYFNSILQCLLTMNILRDHYVSLTQDQDRPITDFLTRHYFCTSPHLELEEKPIKPEVLYNLVCGTYFTHGEQQDCHELLGVFLRSLLEDESESESKNKTTNNEGPSFIDSVFEGEFSRTLSCLVCGETSTPVEPFKVLSLPVPSKERSSKHLPIRKRKVSYEDEVDNSKGPVSIESCLKAFTETEDLSKDEDQTCENCDKIARKGADNKAQAQPVSEAKSHKKAEGGSSKETELCHLDVKRHKTMKTLIKKTPPILTIHLLRYGATRKIHGQVAFNETLDLAPYMESREGSEAGVVKYRLLGVIQHFGEMGSGHYIAYVRGGSDEENDWYRAADENVTKVTLADVLNCEAYMLFYRKL